jgi:hypothetical protein
MSFSPQNPEMNAWICSHLKTGEQTGEHVHAGLQFRHLLKGHGSDER